MINKVGSLVLAVFIAVIVLVGCDPKFTDDGEVFSGDGVSFNMKLVPVPSGGITFPTETDDSTTANIAYEYQVGETQVTWELWKKVYDWAVANGYSFQNPGRMGSAADGTNMTNKHPVTMISWRDSMVWCNAVTQWYNSTNSTSLEPVYRYNSLIVKDSSNANATACDSVVATANNGFRLPTAEEWELAARWRDNNTNTVSGYSNPWFTKGDSASGATANYKNASATGAVAWYNQNSGDRTHEVATKTANSLGIYDMSSNVCEWSY